MCRSEFLMFCGNVYFTVSELERILKAIRKELNEYWGEGEEEDYEDLGYEAILADLYAVEDFIKNLKG